MGNISRSRGYSFENALVHKLRSYGWNAKRLGGASTEFPDIVAVSKLTSMLLAIECKAYSSQKIYIPIKQFHRCFDVCSFFDLYERRLAVFAFKFNRIIGVRKVKYYYGVLSHDEYIEYGKRDVKVMCDYDNGISPKFIRKELITFFDPSS